MTGFFILLGVFMLLVVVMGVRHDRRQRSLRAPGTTRTSARQRRLENHTRADRWGGPGG